MKNLKKLFITFIATLTAIACGEPEIPVELFDVMDKGAFARKMSQTGKYNFFDIQNSSIELHVEYYDEAKGANIAEFDIDIEYRDIIHGGSKSRPRTDFQTISSSEFVVNSDGYLSSDISLPFTSALAAVGATEADIDGGAYFRYHFTITKKDGTVFTNDNTGPNMKSSNAIRALFYLDVSIVCPSALEGTFNTVSVGAGPWGCTATSSQMSFEWVKAGAENLYSVVDGDFSYGAYFTCYGGWGGKPMGNLKVQDACGILSPTGASQWSEVYMFNDVDLSSDRTTLVIDWVNDYGEGAVTTFTNWSGGLWPSGLN